LHIPRKSVSTKIAARQPRSARPPLHFEVVQGHVLSGLWWERGPSGCVARSAAPPAAARFVPISCLWLQRVARRWRTGHFAFPVVNLMYMCVSVWFGAQVARTAGAACLRKLVAGGATAKRCVASSECGCPDAPTLQQMHRLHGPRGVCGATAMPLSPCLPGGCECAAVSSLPTVAPARQARALRRPIGLPRPPSRLPATTARSTVHL
jgi:hypothetical protein